MLLNLHVRNLALIDEVEVDFFDHLNILTGETGAGKSILIGSIEAALGGKVSKDMIRQGAEYALIELAFHIEDPVLEETLRKKEIYLEERQLLISRKIMPGKSVCRINGEVVTMALLREVSALLMDLHGQQENLTLANPARHLEILDQYIGEPAMQLRQQLEAEYSIYWNIKKEYEMLLEDGDRRLRELSFLAYEVKEIQEARLKPGEDEELERLYKRQQNGKDIIQSLNTVYNMTGSGGTNTISDLIGQCVRTFSGVADMDETTKNLYDQLTQMDAIVSDFNRDLSEYLADMSFDENTFLEISERLDTINHLKAKYGNSIEKILAFAEEKQKELEQYEDMQGYKSRLKERYLKHQEKVDLLAQKLHEMRKEYKEKLAMEIKTVLVDLNFLQVAFEIRMEELPDATVLGKDKITFMISTNPGLPLKPLGEVASGGELSRIMLAVKSVLADVDQIGTLIFDEIDTGVSGRTAQKVAEKLSVIARKHQVICITHLPQIAAMADTHFLIEKEMQDSSTETHIRMLYEEDSVAELARLLGGAQITDAVRTNAREMKAMAKSVKEY